MMIYMSVEYQGMGLKPKFTNYPDHGRYGDIPLARENSHSRTGNRTRNLMASSQKF
jgi:hypothetical protein